MLVFFASAIALAAIDSDRNFLKEAGDPWITHQNFEYPYLYSVVARTFSKPSADVAERVLKILEQGKFEFKKSGKLTPPTEVISGEQLEGIQKCTRSKCLVKLQSESEKPVLEGSPQNEKVPSLLKMVLKRVQTFQEKHELIGYEEREENNSTVKKMLSGLAFLPKSYPLSGGFLSGEYWKLGPAPKTLSQSMLRQELVNIAPDKMQPIWRVGETLVFREGAAHLFVDLHIYSNHYFDASLRTIEVLPAEAKSLVVLTDVMEIDELTKSSFIRLLYLSKMEAAISSGQKEELEKWLQ